MEESFPLCQEYYGMDHSVQGKYEFGSEQQFPYCNAAKSSNVVSPLHPGSHQYHKYSGTTNVTSNNQELDLDGEDNALTYIDNILNWDFTAFDVSDSSQDSLPVFGYPYDVNFLADASLPSFSLDALVDERGEYFNAESSQDEQRVPKLEPCCLTDVYDFEVNRKHYNSKEEIIAGDEVSSTSILLNGGEHECDRCEVLRQIVHTSGHQGTKLEIHVCDGDRYHAVMQTKFLLNDGFPPTVERQMVEFPAGNFEYVKQFLLQYSVLQKKEGFMLQQDCLLHDVIATCCKRPVDYVMVAAATCCFKESDHDHYPTILSGPGHFQLDMQSIVGIAGSNCRLPGKDNDSKYETSANEESCSLDGAVKDESLVSSLKPIKSSAAAQREKTGKLKMSDLAKHFHLPINVAAKELGICPTVLKKICRRNGMRRWPHRKIKSIERIIATLEQTIAEGPGLGDEGIRNEIAMLRNERTQLCAGLVGQS